MPQVSIIVPVYNAQQWIDSCVGSIINQSETDWQLILVDDGSTDASCLICDKYAAADKRIVALHQQNAGPSAARNTGIRHATGTFILFVDADDTIHPELLAFLLTLNAQTGADICVASAVRKLDYQFRSLDYSDYKLYCSEEAIKRILYQRQCFLNTIWNILYSRSLFDGLQLTTGLWYEDLDFFYRILKKTTTVCHSPQITYLYRDNPSSFMNTWSHARLDVLKVVDNLEKHMATFESVDLQRAASDRRFSANFNMFALAAKHNEPDICDQCWTVIKALRASELKNREVRIKNKIGALVSYLGKSVTQTIARCAWINVRRLSLFDLKTITQGA